MSEINIRILGAGISGKAAAQLAECLAIPYKILSDDDNPAANENFENCNPVVVSPGIPPSSPLYRKAVASGKEIISELEFAARHFPGRYVAVTGTNGKTTTAELCTHILQNFKINAVAAGNIGHPFSTVCAEIISGKLPENTFAVIEVSSFQLERIDLFAPLAAVILNITEDHLDRYPDGMTGYAAAKKNIFKNVALENRIYGISMKPQQADSCFRLENGIIKFKDSGITAFESLNLKGAHNQENVIAALELAGKVPGVDASNSAGLKKALESFLPGEHRIEKVHEHQGICYIDDSKGTNPAAVAAALNSIPAESVNIRLILGGLDKGMDFSLLQEYSARIAKAYIFGECRDKIYEALSGTIKCGKFKDFDKCILTACREAERGDAVLLSPGCASWDMFNNYKERGRRFRSLVSCFTNNVKVEISSDSPFDF